MKNEAFYYCSHLSPEALPENPEKPEDDAFLYTDIEKITVSEKL